MDTSTPDPRLEAAPEPPEKAAKYRRPASSRIPSIVVALFAAANAVRNVLRILKSEQSLTPTFPHLIPLEDYYDLVGLKAMLSREESYDKSAAALVQKRAAE